MAHPPGRAVAKKADSVQRFPGGPRGYDDPLATPAADRLESPPDVGEEHIRLDHSAPALLALRQFAERRTDELVSEFTETLEVLARRRVLVHAGIHRRCQQGATRRRQQRRREQIVGEPTR